MSRQVTHSKSLAVALRGLRTGGERSETSELAAAVDLNRLSEEIQDKVDDERLAAGLTYAPQVSDQEILTYAADQLAASLGEMSRTRETLRTLQEAFETEKLESIAKQKREELREVAERSKMVIIRGSFERANARADQVVIRLTGLETASIAPTASISAFERHEMMYAEGTYFGPLDFALTETSTIAMPDGVGIEVVLADPKSLTPSGAERLQREGSFHAAVIAHSPSYSESTGVLTAAAYACWGITASPRRVRPRLSPAAMRAMRAASWNRTEARERAERE